MLSMLRLNNRSVLRAVATLLQQLEPRRGERNVFENIWQDMASGRIKSDVLKRPAERAEISAHSRHNRRHNLAAKALPNRTSRTRLDDLARGPKGIWQIWQKPHFKLKICQNSWQNLASGETCYFKSKV
jgi:hypothetical protein